MASHHEEAAYRRGVQHAARLATDAIALGATAEDMRAWEAVVADWREGRVPSESPPQPCVSAGARRVRMPGMTRAEAAIAALAPPRSAP